jgi:hypothetical protein
MSEVIARTDIEAFAANTFPEHLDVIKAAFIEYLDSTFNHSDLTPQLTALPTYFDQFQESSISQMLMYDKALAQYSHYDIRSIIGLSIVNEGPGFFTRFFSHFFDRFELFYSDYMENRYETLSGVIYTDEGHLTDGHNFTDDGIGVGPYCILATVIFGIAERAAVESVYYDAYRLLTIMKPARLFVFLIPTVDIRFNELLSGDEQYIPALVTGGDPSFTLVMATVTASGLTVSVNATNKTFTRSTGVWADDGFFVGSVVTFSGTGLNAGNKQADMVVSVATATVLTFGAATGLFTEAGITDVGATASASNRPGQLITDKSPTPWNTDGGITSDYFSVENYLLGLTSIIVKYADAPSTPVTLTAQAYAIPKDYGFFFSAETEITKEVVYVELKGSSSIFSVQVLKPLYLKAFNNDGNMRLRISWNVPFGEGTNA